MAAASVIALVGPTGSGKTDLGIELARRFGAEIINADSRQVYRGLDIGSAKPTAAQQAAAPHHCLDLAQPDEPFSCARFLDIAEPLIAAIEARGKRVLIVGGTGLYVKVLRGGLFDGPARDQQLRDQLEAEEDADPGSLHRRLQLADPPAAARLHRNDRVRLVRAVEVLLLTGKPISEWHQGHGFQAALRPMLTLALDLPRALLYERINRRCETMVGSGLIEEVQRLYAAGYDPRLPALQSLGYREIGAHVRGECDLQTALAKMAQATRNFAKRQLTWFRGDREALWCNPRLEALWEHAQKVWG